MERNFKGIWIPKEIWLNEELTLQEKVMLVEIDSLDNEETGCYASNSYFAKFFKLSNARVTQIINSLVSKGFISTNYQKNGKEIVGRIININRPPYPEIEVVRKLTTYLENYKGGSKFSYEGYLENYKDNNIEYNNIEYNIKEKNKRKVFIKPTIEEISSYCLERNNGINAEAFYDFYESKGWYVGKNKMKDWKACVRTWEKRDKSKLESKTKMELQRERQQKIMEDFVRGEN